MLLHAFETEHYVELESDTGYPLRWIRVSFTIVSEMSVWLRYTTLVGGSEPWEFAIDVFEDMLLAFEKTAFVYKNSVNKAWLIGNPPQLRATHKLLLDEAGGRPRCPGSAALVGQVAAITHFTGFAARGAWAAALSSLEDLQVWRVFWQFVNWRFLCTGIVAGVL